MIQDCMPPKLMPDIIGSGNRTQGVCQTPFEYLLVILLWES